MSVNFKIETERLVLREFTPDDVDPMFELNQDEEVMRYTGDKAFKDKQEVLSLISNYEQYKKYKTGRCTVLLKSTGEYVGWCGLKYLADINEVDLGYRLMRNQWGKGYATESSVATLNYGFDTLKLEKIVGRAEAENVRSVHVLKKLGMIFEKTLVDNNRSRQQYFILRNEWYKIRETIPAAKQHHE